MPVQDRTKKELESKFGPVSEEHVSVWEKLSKLMEIFDLDAEELFIRWESFNVSKMNDDLPLTVVNLDIFQEHLQSSLSKGTPSIKKSRDLQSNGIKMKPMMRPNAPLTSSPTGPSTPNLKRRKVNEPSSALKPSYLSSPVTYDTANETLQSSSPIKKPPQPESNPVLECLNPHIEIIEADEVRGVKLASNFDAGKFKFRTMAMKLLESADVLDDQIDSYAQMFQDMEIPVGNPCMSSQSDILCTGRIVPDSPTDDTSLNYTPNKSSLFLETSRFSGIGQRIRLDLNHLKQFSLFPGQIVTLRGKNPTGSTFIVEEVIPPPALGLPITPKDELDEYKEQLGGSQLKLLVASGPFSNEVTLDYQQLANLTDTINQDIKPNVVVLLGPFLDMNNQAVSSGEINLPDEKQQPQTLDEVFKKLITPILKRINPKTQVILIPSLSDTCIKHCSYPQDAFDRKALGLPKNFKVFPNPSSFSINEVLVGCSNLDIFGDLRDVYQVDSSNPNIGAFNNRFERITNHIFEQRRYYPYLPGSIKRLNVNNDNKDELANLQGGVVTRDNTNTTIGGSSLEIPYLGLTELGDSLPDILISPSKLKSFVKVIKGVVVINPGYFSRGTQGTYGVVTINAPDDENDDNVELVSEGLDVYYHNVFKRARVEIMKS
ncbi:DNA polymerase alpha, subunit B [Suhomyces tanzawaensis NRRL Y-17324]|uniref:DNA polymerase alpha subunit B n=1 Tax=Suhomyces tanzawaensis NRRL Y-17324 TaxID=984487 RepID=A0A1E4SDG0_9ASCO|nr:DNA polymerase alpha, subunit B [Suhomyces tanzawaensis NRRL Y-17324]ODV77508.1 DNA polymerase alpha, subunit B [Suhomyces tanzawaensis NRRL Y-17324]